jgi:glycosyltransferase involved in cell wall biosynthesis
MNTHSPDRIRPVSLAYLLSQYPMLSMIFVNREVLQLRAMGFQINVASINHADRRTEELTADELSEAQQTHYVLSEGATGALIAHVAALLTLPGTYLRGWRMVFHLGQFDLRRLFMNGIYFTEALMVGRWMKRVGQHHLHVHLAAQAATVGLYVKRVFGFGYSITVHGPDEFYDARGQYLTEKIVAADFIICISHFARSQLMKLSPYEYWGKLHVSRLGVNPSVFSPRVTPRDSNLLFEIICVGRLTPAKGQHVLIDAVKLLTDAGRHVRLRVVGGGVDGDSLKRHVRQLGLTEIVVFEGAVNQDRIHALFAQANCLCLPSFAEGIPVVLMEAMSMGIPCVTTHITGIPELIRHGESGLLVAPSDVRGLAENLALLMDDPGLAQRIATAGRAKVLADYDLTRNVSTLGALLARLVDTHVTHQISATI